MKEILETIRSIDYTGITDVELEKLLPTFGMNNELTHEMPKELEGSFGKGVRFWQYPNQFSKYLKQLSNYKINSYLEVGCRWGGTFIITSELLRTKNKKLKSYACDIIQMSDVLTEYQKLGKFTYINDSSLNLTKESVQDSVDLILIDGDHSYDGVKKDFENCLKLYSPKYVAFHDILSDACPDVVRFWNEIKENYQHYEFTEQYKSVSGNFLGIGLIIL